MKIKSALILLGLTAGCAIGHAQNTPIEAAAPASTTTLSEVMPLIVISDAPLPDAIGNLARQAGINIQFDPKVLSGGPDPKNPNATLPPPNVTFHWENVTPMQALYALLENYDLQLTQDPKSKISRVTIKQPNALDPLIPRVITLRYSQSQVTNLIPMVKAVAGVRGQVLADVRTGQLLVMATEADILAVEELVAKLDVPPSQILIEARFVETRQNPKSAKGVDWTGTLAAHNLSFGNRSIQNSDADPLTAPVFPTEDKGSVTGTTTGLGGSSGVLPSSGQVKTILSTAGGFNGIGFLNSDGLNAVVSFLNTDNQTETLSTPRAVALEGVATELSVVQNIPVFEQRQGSASGGIIPPAVIAPNYNLEVHGTILNEVGTKLKVTPRIYGVTNVFLDLKPEISTRGLDEKVIFDGTPSQAPTFFRKKIETQALVPSGYTVVLGGLTEDSNSKISSKVPVFGDIPFVGRAFRSDQKTKNKTQILIFVTPTILVGEDFLPSEDSRDFMQQKSFEKPDTQWSDYDSASPKDWTKAVE